MGNKDKEVVKLQKYLKHWAEHNESHKESYLKWKEIANNKGLHEISGLLEEAIERMDQSTKSLLKAHDILENNYE